MRAGDCSLGGSYAPAGAAFHHDRLYSPSAVPGGLEPEFVWTRTPGSPSSNARARSGPRTQAAEASASACAPVVAITEAHARSVAVRLNIARE